VDGRVVNWQRKAYGVRFEAVVLAVPAHRQLLLCAAPPVLAVATGFVAAKQCRARFVLTLNTSCAV